MKSPQKKHIHQIIFICLLMVFGWGQDCDEGYVWIDEIPELCDTDGNCFYHSDLDVLQTFIDNSSETINMNMDVDGNGLIEPLELGKQEWVDGRIIDFDCYISWVNNCELTGEIPSEIGNLTYLDWLYLWGNQLTGEIPVEIGNLSNLTHLKLSGNQLTGEIPSEIGNLTNLTSLILGDNQLTGEIPSEIGNLTNLELIYFSNNQLTGSIPSEIENLTNLTSLWLSSNQLSGEIPVEIGNLNNLEYLNLSVNHLVGVIPEGMCYLPEDCSIWIDNNQFCPPYPDCLSENIFTIGYQDTTFCEESQCNEETEVELWGVCYNIEETTELDLSDNELTGHIPFVIENLINLEVLNLSSNNLTGMIPYNIGNLLNLRILDLSNNNLIFHPSEDTSEDYFSHLISDLINLELLDLGDNNLEGEIPPEIGNLTNLQILRLNDNTDEFEGGIPPEIGNLISLIELDLSGNELEGHIPSEIGNLIDLEIFNLGHNDFSGELPSSIGNLTNLRILDIGGVEQGEGIEGNIPIELGNLINLNILDLYGHSFEGTIPIEIGNLINLNELDLRRNKLTGEIPEEICNQGDITPSLSNNQLCPPYPECLSEDDIGEQDCIYFNGVFTEIDGEWYFQGDLYVLQLFIDNSSETINMDMDVNGDGVIEPLELGVQEWIDGRLTNLSCYLGYYNSGNNFCNISGEIPSEIGNLTNLTHLRFQKNQLTGEIPSEIGNLTNLTFLNLGGNELIGEIPSEIGNLTNLYELWLYDNQLTGEILLEMINLINLETLSLTENNFFGEIPIYIDNLINLENFYLCNNQFNGEIPSIIGNLINLEEFELCNNQFWGEIPSDIWNLNLSDEEFKIYNNNFTFNTEIGVDDTRFLNLQNGSDILQLNNGYGNNLVSLSYISHKTNRDGIIFIYNQPPNFILGQGVGCFLTENGSYSGNLNTLEITSGYWINLQEPQESISILEFDNSDIEYNLSTGNNLISYPKKQPMSTSELPQELLEITNFILGQGQGLFKDSNGDWNGNLNQLNPNKGYWFNVDNSITFQYPQETTLLSKTYHPMDVYDGIPEEFHFFQSTEQSFYLFKDIQLNNQSTNSDDYIILSYNNNELTGSGLYTGMNSTIVTMGKDITPGTEQFHQIGDTPTFKLYNKSTDEFISLYGDVPSWTSNNFQEIELLKGEEDVIPEEYEFGVSVYPNPFNPTTTINVMLSKDNLTEVKVYDIQGKHITTLMNQQMKQGHHQIEWNGENLSSGTYFIRINSGEFSDVKKVVLVK